MIKPIENTGPASAEVSPNIVATIATVPLRALLNQTRAIRRAAERFLRRRDRTEHPEGKCDRAGRWYPADSENFDHRGRRIPSRAWPWSYMQACRTLAHCAHLEGVPGLVSEVRKAARKLDQEAKSANKEAQAK